MLCSQQFLDGLGENAWLLGEQMVRRLPSRGEMTQGPAGLGDQHRWGGDFCGWGFPDFWWGAVRAEEDPGMKWRGRGGSVSWEPERHGGKRRCRLWSGGPVRCQGGCGMWPLGLKAVESDGCGVCKVAAGGTARYSGRAAPCGQHVRSLQPGGPCRFS